jgi:pimeloyl-ACP methyl ester carboxylesterase
MEITYEGQPVRIATGGKGHDSDAPGVVLIHGSGMDRTTWQMQSRWLAHHGFRVAAVDLPGHGLSGGEPIQTVEEMGRWTAGLVHELGLAPAHLVGFSTGTYVALEAASQDDTCARSLVLIGTATTMPVHPELLSSSYDDVGKASGLMVSWGTGSRSHRGGHKSPGTWQIGASRAMLDRSPKDALGHDMAAVNAYTNAVAAASSISVPVTFVLGAEDKMAPIRSSGDLISAVADHRVITLDSTGHFMPTEDPIAVRDAIAEGIGWDGTR